MLNILFCNLFEHNDHMNDVINLFFLHVQSDAQYVRRRIRERSLVHLSTVGTLLIMNKPRDSLIDSMLGKSQTIWLIAR